MELKNLEENGNMLEVAGIQVYMRFIGQREIVMVLGFIYCSWVYWVSQVYFVVYGVFLVEFEDFLFDCGSISSQCGGCFFGV